MCQKGCIPTRFVIAIMLFTSCVVTYMTRVNISINLIAMVQPIKDDTGNVSIPECGSINWRGGLRTDGTFTAPPDYGTRYDWDTKLQGLILSSYFYGYIVTCLPGGYFAERIGPTKVVMGTTVIAGVLTILGPVLTAWHYIALIVSRVLVGSCGGLIYPCLHCLVSRWAPPEEKGKFIGALLGGSLGTIVAWPFLGAVIENYGWAWSFYINGIIVLAWCIFWILLVADSPEKHPRISEKEKLYITDSLRGAISETERFGPFKDILTSVPFWALVILHFGNLWGLFFLMTAGPNFLSSVLGYTVGHTGLLAAVPYLARLIFGIIFGEIGDFIRRRNFLSTNAVRKGFVVFSHFIPGLLLLILSATGCHIIWSIILLTFSLGSNGASTLTNLQNSQDLAPNFAGSLYGVANGIGCTTGFITPLIVGQLTWHHNGLHEWHIIFGIGGSVYIICGIIFCIFGSAEIQPWNHDEPNEAKN